MTVGLMVELQSRPNVNGLLDRTDKAGLTTLSHQILTAQWCNDLPETKERERERRQTKRG